MSENSTTRITKKILISGRVQGVFFRVSTLEAAERIGNIEGWVRNTSDGKVEAVFRGCEENLNEIIQWCNQGPDQSKVSNVEGLDFSEDELQPPIQSGKFFIA